MKYLILARGPGESGQAVALAKYIAKKGKGVIFCFHKANNSFFLKKQKNIKTFFAPEFADFEKIVKAEKPERVLFFNSKFWLSHLKEKPAFLENIKCFSVDSNWLFNNKKYPAYQFIPWLEKYFVLFPKKVFSLGLKENAGDFAIDNNILPKIIPVGFMPSYQPPKKNPKEKKEKIIFAYFSGYGAGHRVWALDNLVKAVDLLIKKGRKIKVVYVGPAKGISEVEKLKRPWLVFKENLPAYKFFTTLANSDLIFQHQGMVTLAQAISANIPVIANVSVLTDEALPFIHFWEVGPFVKASCCLMQKQTDSPLLIAKNIATLLYNKTAIAKMKKSQKQILEKGEKEIYFVTKLNDRPIL